MQLFNTTLLLILAPTLVASVTLKQARNLPRQFLGNLGSSSKRLKHLAGIKSKDPARTAVFGRSLEDLGEEYLDTLGVPKVMAFLGDLIRKNVEEEGIFRISASAAVVAEAQRILEQTTDPYTIPMDNELFKNAHVVSNLFKQFLREIPGKMISKDDFALLKQVVDEAGGERGQFGAEEEELNRRAHTTRLHKVVGEIAGNMSPVRRESLDYVLKLILDVAKHSESNLMNLHNLCVVFAPNLFDSSAKDAAEMIRESEDMPRVLESILGSYAELGSDVELHN